MSKTVGYARVSTSEQNLDRQLQALEQYVEPDMIVTDKASGKNPRASRSRYWICQRPCRTFRQNKHGSAT